MKSKLFVGLILWVCTLSMNALGIPEFISNSSPVSHAFTVKQNDWNAGTVELQILDNEETVIFRDRISNHEIGMKKFITQGLADGQYTIQWLDDLAFISQNLKIEDSELVFCEESYRVVYKPVIEVLDGLINISMLSLNETVNTKLYDPLGREIFSESSAPEISYQKRLNVIQAIKGDYTLSVQCKNQTFQENISLKN